MQSGDFMGFLIDLIKEHFRQTFEGIKEDIRDFKRRLKYNR